MTSDDRPVADQPRPEDRDRDMRGGRSAVDDAELLAMARRGCEVLHGRDADHVASLWDGIAAAAFDEPTGDVDDRRDPPTTADDDGVAEAAVAEAGVADAGVAGAGVPDPGEGSTAATATAGAGSPPDRGEVVDLAARRSLRGVGAALGAVAAALVVVLGGVWVATRDADPVPVASFDLGALDDRATDVSGTIVAVDDGGTHVDVDLGSLPAAPDGTFYELWLLDADAGELVSLGPVEDQTSFVVPAAVDVGDWPLLDVSVEPVDGDPTHSSDSVLRGEIVAAPAD